MTWMVSSTWKRHRQAEVRLNAFKLCFKTFGKIKRPKSCLNHFWGDLGMCAPFLLLFVGSCCCLLLFEAPSLRTLNIVSCKLYSYPFSWQGVGAVEEAEAVGEGGAVGGVGVQAAREKVEDEEEDEEVVEAEGRRHNLRSVAGKSPTVSNSLVLTSFRFEKYSRRL